jgi:pyruvate formate lyase activating enzyme
MEIQSPDGTVMVDHPVEANVHSKSLQRRDFLKATTKYGLTLAGLDLLVPGGLGELLGLLDGGARASGPLEELLRTAPQARYWISTMGGTDCQTCHPLHRRYARPSHNHGGRMIKCLLCAQGCLIEEGERGQCRTRVNVEGDLRSLVYGHPITMHIDPIEKGPFFHFLPGSPALSLATAGCPLQCKFCQNWQISQARPDDYSASFTPPERISSVAKERRNPVIMFTYNEPTVFVEYLTDIARRARGQDLRSVLVSCGFMTKEPLEEMCEVLDAIKIDLKGFDPGFYREVCSAELDPVLRSIRQVAKSKAHLEIVNLVVPTLNDSDRMLGDLADWVMGEVGPDVPLHFTRFAPEYQLRNLQPTPVATLERAREIAMAKGLRFVFVGNVPGHPANSTYCPGCGEAVIKRSGFFVRESRLQDGKCGNCGEVIPGVWS